MLNFMSRNYSPQSEYTAINRPKVAFKHAFDLQDERLTATSCDENDIPEMVKLKKRILIDEFHNKNISEQENCFDVLNSLLLASRRSEKDKSTVHAIKVAKDFDANEVRGGRFVKVKYKEGKIVGSAALSSLCNIPLYNEKPENKEIGLISNVYIDRNIRGNGIGKKLVAHMIEHAKEYQYKKLLLVAIDKNARRLYKKLGFTEVKDKNCIKEIKAALESSPGSTCMEMILQESPSDKSSIRQPLYVYA